MIVICPRCSGSSADWTHHGKQKNHATAVITTGWKAEVKAGVPSGGAGRRRRRDAGKTTFFFSPPPLPSLTRGKRKGCCLGTAQTQFPFKKKIEKFKKKREKVPVPDITAVLCLPPFKVMFYLGLARRTSRA